MSEPENGRTYFSRSTKVMFSAISATRFAILEAMMVYGDICCCDAPFDAPFVWGFLFALAEGFFADLEAVVLLAERLTGADATEAAGILKGVYEVWR
jgi:hypothetical protein